MERHFVEKRTWAVCAWVLLGVGMCGQDGMYFREERRMDSEYIVNIRRDTGMMKTFIKFSNRVHHPRVSLHLFLIGAALLGMPIAAGGGKPAGIAICVAGGGFLVFMSLFRHNIAVARMKKNPEIEENEELSYCFGKKGVQIIKNGERNNLGGYKKIYGIWEDEKHFYVGMNEEDLLILPKANFETGDKACFRDYLIEKSGADYSWKPANLINICKQKLEDLKRTEAEQREQLKKKSK